MKITQIIGREIFDSRGFPTVECEVILDNNHSFLASVPSGISKGSHEAVELRDGGNRLAGQGVLKAIENIEQRIAPALIGHVPNVVEMDLKMIGIDDSENKSNLGANAMLAVSYAVLRSQAALEGLETYEFITDLCNFESVSLPIPLINIINGGQHADNNLIIQEYMVAPKGQQTIRGALESVAGLFYELKDLLRKLGKSTLVGDEGGFAPDFNNEREALDTIMQAMGNTQKKYGHEFVIALDAASNFFYNQSTKTYDMHGKKYTTDELIEWYTQLTKEYPLFSIEDGLHENDWEGWSQLTATLGESVQIVGDDIFTTDPEKITIGIEKKAANAVLIKPNQIGTVTETLQAIHVCKDYGMNTIVSHRSGETEDTFIADLAVGTSSGQIKTGGYSRGERMAKYNRLLRIEDRLTLSALTG